MKLIIFTFLFFGCVQTKQKQEDEIKPFNLPLKVSGDEKGENLLELWHQRNWVCENILMNCLVENTNASWPYFFAKKMKKNDSVLQLEIDQAWLHLNEIIDVELAFYRSPKVGKVPELVDILQHHFFKDSGRKLKKPIYPNDLKIKVKPEFQNGKNLWVGVKDFTYIEEGVTKRFSEVVEAENLFKKFFYLNIKDNKKLYQVDQNFRLPYLSSLINQKIVTKKDHILSIANQDNQFFKDSPKRNFIGNNWKSAGFIYERDKFNFLIRKTYEDLRDGVFLQVDQFSNPELRFGEEIKIKIKKVKEVPVIKKIDRDILVTITDVRCEERRCSRSNRIESKTIDHLKYMGQKIEDQVVTQDDVKGLILNIDGDERSVLEHCYEGKITCKFDGEQVVLRSLSEEMIRVFKVEPKVELVEITIGDKPYRGEGNPRETLRQQKIKKRQGTYLLSSFKLFLRDTI